MSYNRYYSKVQKIQEAYTTEAANSAIESGWELLSIRDYTHRELQEPNFPIIVTRPVYILGYLRRSSQ
jgi:hypothetical protein